MAVIVRQLEKKQRITIVYQMTTTIHVSKEHYLQVYKIWELMYMKSVFLIVSASFEYAL